MIRPTWVEVDLAAVAANLAVARQITRPGSAIIAVVKGDAYGMGLLPVAQKLLQSGADALAVGNVDEGLRLRRQGVQASILVLEPVLPGQGLEEAARARLSCAASIDADGARLKEAAEKAGCALFLHLRAEPGEPGALPDPRDLARRWGRLQPWLQLRGLFFHPSRFREGAVPAEKNRVQEFCRWSRAVQRFYGTGLQVHVCDSRYLLQDPALHLDAVRTGSLLLGLLDSSSLRGLEPVLSWRTRVALVKDVPAGTGVSYGLTYSTSDATRLAALPVGYADGLRRGLSNRMEVLVRGRRVPQVGRICMDQCLVDLGDWPEVEAGERVTLLGRDGPEEIGIGAWAAKLGVSGSELAATVGPRVHRLYGEGGAGFACDHLGRN